MEKQLYWIYKENEWEKTNSENIENIDKEYVCLRSEKDYEQDNLINLTYLNEPSILYNIQNRYNYDNIYTFNGDILVAVNPFKKINIYNIETIDYYNSKPYDNLNPHAYFIGKKSLDNLKYKNNQSILVSGESGAGKTQTTKIIMNYISEISSKDQNNISEKILASNPILEAFGNSKTLRNDNSSRFGKFIKILFNKNNKIMGAEIKTYLLEKIRVTNLSNDERNFHIFYMLYNGLSDNQRKHILLDDIKNYNYLNCSDIFEREDNVSDAGTFNELYNSFIKLDFRENKINYIFKIISAILNVGNINTNCNIGQNIYLNNFCFLLGFNIDIIIDFFSYKYINIHNEIIKKQIDENNFIIMRDSFSQLLYTCLFNNIVEHINKKQQVKSDKFIGILDIFGFEVFKHNGFEQLCINYTNEKLQELFNKFIFEIEQEEYKKEGINWKNIQYPDNQKIINLFEKKNIGLFDCLIEQCILSKGSDKKFFDQVSKNNDNDILNIANKDRHSLRFMIRHYADDVKYTSDNFIVKNRNQIDERLTEIFKNGCPLIKEFKLPQRENKKNSLKKNNLIYQFRKQLKELLNTISLTKQYYIRCIKPNDKNICNDFDKTRVLEQLRYCGIMEAIKIAKAGYPVRLLKNEFIDKFYTLMNFRKIIPLNDYINLFINKEFNIEKLEYQVGITKVFMKKHIYDELVKNNNAIINYNIIIIQKYFRGWNHKRIYLNILSKIKNIQRIWKYKILHRNKSSFIISNFMRALNNFIKYNRIRENVILIQSLFRMHKTIIFFKRIKAIIKIQSVWRMNKSIKYYKTKKYENNCAYKIQKQWRHNKNRNILVANIKKIIDDNNEFNLLKSQLNREKKEKENLILEAVKISYELELKQKETERKLIEKEKEIERLKNINHNNIPANTVICLNECPLDNQTHDEMAQKMEQLYLRLNKTREALRLEQEKPKCNIM